jgi:hypothetical protein
MRAVSAARANTIAPAQAARSHRRSTGRPVGLAPAPRADGGAPPSGLSDIDPHRRVVQAMRSKPRRLECFAN